MRHALLSTFLALSAGLLLAGAALAADPLPNGAPVVAGAPPTAYGPIYDGKKHQPTLGEVDAREQAVGRPPEPGPASTKDSLYQSVLERSQKPLPQRLDEAQ
jgi:hypothetical protein